MKNEKEDKKSLEKIDRITKFVMIGVCCALGAVFVAACTYMLKMIGNEQGNDTAVSSSETIKK